MKALLVLALLAVVSYAYPMSASEEFFTYKRLYNKQYDSEEEELIRNLIFHKNLDYIIKHNKLADQGLKSYRLGINQFTDMDNHEFRKMMNGYQMSANRTGIRYIPPANVDVADSVDWRHQGAVTEVKNQAQCGSCWAFSTTGSLEGQVFRSTGTLVSLSEQNLIDCSRKFGNMGCSGGLMDQAFKYVESNHGIDREDRYPYQSGHGEDDFPCRYHSQSRGGTCKSHVDVESGNEDDLKSAAATIGPISVAIDASHMSFQLYHSGVYDEPNCSSTQLDHGVLVVGYDTDSKGQDYWIVKNSWGPGWGNNGYLWMSRNKDNQCGIATQASYPQV